MCNGGSKIKGRVLFSRILIVNHCSCVLATTANVTSQRISGAKKLNQHSVFAYGLFGLIFGGTVPHYFYQIVERLFSHDVRFRKFFVFLSERLAFAPLYQLLSLYFLSIFEVSF